MDDGISASQTCLKSDVVDREVDVAQDKEQKEKEQKNGLGGIPTRLIELRHRMTFFPQER
jgi:hypothetical protein